MSARWIDPFRRAIIKGDPNPWCDRLRERIDEWAAVDAERAKLLRRSVELPDGLIDNADACDAISRAAKGQKLWPLMALGKGAAKALVSAIRMDGAPVKDEDIEGWRYVAAVIANTVRQREVRARWDAFAKEIGAPMGGYAKTAIDLATKTSSNLRRRAWQVRPAWDIGFGRLLSRDCWQMIPTFAERSPSKSALRPPRYGLRRSNRIVAASCSFSRETTELRS